jgi:single-strand DNA-binding protein
VSLKVYGPARLTHDPEIREIGDGKRAATIRLAFDQGWGDRKHTVYLDAEFFNGMVDVIDNYVKKGQQVFIDGQLHLDKYTNKDGEAKEKFRIKNPDLTLLGSKNDGENSSPAPPANTGKNSNRAPARPQSSAKPNNRRQPEPESDDDIPF